jgi:hypothetical protein
MKTYHIKRTPNHTFLFEENPYNPKKTCVGIFKNTANLEKKLEEAKKRLEDHGLIHQN